MALFLSTITNKVDRKGRVSVPAPYRTNLCGPGASPNGTVVLFPSPHVTALEGYTIEQIEALAARLDTLEVFSDEYEELNSLFASAHQLTLDSEGRIGIPEELMAAANITDAVAFVGGARTFQLWEPTAHAKHAAELRERMRANKRTFPVGAAAQRPVTP